MSKFNVYKHATKGPVAVKIGFSWPGFFFTWVWMLIKQLWGMAIAWIAIWIVMNILFSAAGYAGSQGGTNPLALGGLGLWLALHLIPGFNGNKWRESNLANRGYSQSGTFEAESAEAAISQANGSKA